MQNSRQQEERIVRSSIGIFTRLPGALEPPIGTRGGGLHARDFPPTLLAPVLDFDGEVMLPIDPQGELEGKRRSAQSAVRQLATVRQPKQQHQHRQPASAPASAEVSAAAAASSPAAAAVAQTR
ncbi:hypothetical protein V8E36_004642 [Tilletia maclaganii]